MTADQITQGRRLPDGTPLKQAGDYGFFPDTNEWLVWLPNGSYTGYLNHTITEHDDGTISVSPSILMQDDAGRTLWHGFLEHGVWREV